VQFIVHAALDIVDQRAAATPAMFLKGIDKFNDMTVSSFVTASGTPRIYCYKARFPHALRLLFEPCFCFTTLTPYLALHCCYQHVV